MVKLEDIEHYLCTLALTVPFKNYLRVHGESLLINASDPNQGLQFQT